MRATTVCCIGAIMLVAGCQKNNEPTPTDTGTATATGTAMAPKTGMESGSPAAEAPMAAQDFANKVSGSNLYEIEAAKIAKDKSKTDRIRDFADEMIDDHGEAQSELQAAVTAAGNGLRFDPKLDADQKSQLDALRKATADFDHVYVTQQRAAHEQALALVRDYAESGDVQQLRDTAKKASDMVAEHLQKAKELPSS